MFIVCQMKQACGVPMAAGAALMPDAHVGYGLPIGGVLALENAVIPYAVGVDIACRMKLSILDLPPATLDDDFNRFKEAIEGGTHFGTRFGIGSTHERPQDRYRWKAVQKDLEKKGVRVLFAGADEVPGVYKDIEDVMREQADLVEIVARFDPKIVKMCDDGTKVEASTMARLADAGA
jgi:RNA-splicing ligase RtcB